jgi:hypothetical protein
MKKLIVLDFTLGVVDIYQYDENTTTAEDVMTENGNNSNSCQWMIVDVLQVTIH